MLCGRSNPNIYPGPNYCYSKGLVVMRGGSIFADLCRVFIPSLRLWLCYYYYSVFSLLLLLIIIVFVIIIVRVGRDSSIRVRDLLDRVWIKEAQRSKMS